MIAWLARSFGLSPIIVWALIALAVTGSFTAWGSYNEFIGKQEGKRIERAAWEEAMAKLREQMRRERLATQAMIDQIEREYLNQRDRDQTAIRDLETLILELETEDADTPASSRVFFPRRLSEHIGQIGR